MQQWQSTHVFLLFWQSFLLLQRYSSGIAIATSGHTWQSHLNRVVVLIHNWISKFFSLFYVFFWLKVSGKWIKQSFVMSNQIDVCVYKTHEGKFNLKCEKIKDCNKFSKCVQIAPFFHLSYKQFSEITIFR